MMDEQIRSLIRQKLEIIAREEDAALMNYVDTVWKDVDPGPHCAWIGEAMQRVNQACVRAIDARGVRMALTLSKTFANLKPRYTKNLAAELKALVDPFFPEDLYLAPAINTRGVYQRRGNPQKFNERTYEHALVLARVGSANTLRDSKQRAYLAIDEYMLLAKSEHGGGFWDSLELKPNIYGLGINLKKLFSRNKTPSE
jgi:hypothetical protein